jgi:hypothetical protein
MRRSRGPAVESRGDRDLFLLLFPIGFGFLAGDRSVMVLAGIDVAVVWRTRWRAVMSTGSMGGTEKTTI